MKQTIFLIRNIAPDCYGGAESYQVELAKILTEHGYQPIIFTASKKLLSVAKQNHIKAIKAPYNKHQNWSGWRNLLLPVYIIWQLRLYFWYKKQITLYHPVALDIQSRDEWIAATLAGKTTHTKVFWTDHIDFRTWVFQNINQRGKNFIGKYILKLCHIPHRIIAISDYEAKWLQKNVKHDFQNLVTIKNGVIDQREQYQDIKPARQSFCYVGRLIDYKGIKELIAAFNTISSKYPAATLHIYGDGPVATASKRLAQDNSQIYFHGYTNAPLRAIAESQIFVLPSYYEGLSIALLEASMLGRTIIATNVDGNPEVIINNKTGLTIPPKNTKALADVMNHLLENTALAKEFAKNTRIHYEQNFDFSKIIEQQFIPLLKD